nr:MAG TPA: DNA-packaging protein [Bacteriophage sp.]
MNSTESSLCELCKTRQINTLLEEYISLCAKSSDGGQTSEDMVCQTGNLRKKTDRCNESAKACFPNVAGFCRYLGVGTRELEKLASEYPDEYGRILTILEDEALNSGLSATLLSAYLKKRLGYGSVEKGKSDNLQLQVSFDHDIFEDGE